MATQNLIKMEKGSILEHFTPLGPGMPGPSSDLVLDIPQSTRADAPKTGLFANMTGQYDFGDNRDFKKFIIDPDLNNILDDYKFTGSALSPGIQAKATHFGVLGVIGKHKSQANFSGVDGFAYTLQPSEIMGYNNFLQSLTPYEQDEYASFLGIDFKKIGNAIGSAAKSVGHAVGSAATAVGHVVAGGATAVGHAVGSVATGVGHVARAVALPVAHVVRDVAVPVAKFTWKNLPYIASAIAIAAGQPELAAGILGAMAALKSQGASDSQIQQTLADQGLGAPYDAGGNTLGDGSDPENPDAQDEGPDANGDVQFPDGSVYNVNTGKLIAADGTVTTSSPPVKKTNWLLYGSIAVAVIALLWYLHKKGKLNFKFLKHLHKK